MTRYRITALIAPLIAFLTVNGAGWIWRFTNVELGLFVLLLAVAAWFGGMVFQAERSR